MKPMTRPGAGRAARCRAFTLIEGLWLGGVALLVLGGGMVGWGFRQKGRR